MERPPESLKSFANRIAEVAFSEDAAQLVRLLQLSGFMGGALDICDVNDAGDRFVPPPNPEHVGIWQRKVEDGRICFVRRTEMMHEWIYWANLGRIEAKGTKRRVVLIGESVARGYFYDPHFTPAIALETILNRRFADSFEVIDLARTALSHEVRELAVSALQLEPDAVIIFSGNNWGLSFPRPSEVAAVDAALAQHGISGAKRVSEAQIAANAEAIVRDISSAYDRASVPLIWIIPEFNLGDWRDPVTNAPHLPAGLNREWLALLDEARSAVRDGEFERAEGLAGRMVELDGGACVAGLYILADCRRRAGDDDGERKYLEMARDAVSWDPSRKIMPRCYSVTQRAMRDEMGRRRNQVVDLPALFKEYLDGRIPDRRLFLDYCHLTSEGIRVAMGAAASCVLRALKGVEVPWYALVDDHIAPPPEVEAEASFLTAILYGHWSPSFELVRHYCGRALKLSPHVADLMLNYLELQTQSAIPMRMSRVEERISRLGSPLMQYYLLHLNEKRLDKVLLDAVVDALAEVGVDGRSRLDELRREEHSVTAREMNLLDYYYCSSADQLQDLSWLIRTEGKKGRPEAEYYKAYCPESRFIFVGEAGCPVRLTLTCRLPRLALPSSSILVVFNGKPQAEMVITREWSTWDIGLAGEVVRDGLNEVAVRWPLPEFPGTQGLEEVRSALYEGRFPAFYPVFGEIHSFTASDGRKAPTDAPVVEQEPASVEVSSAI